MASAIISAARGCPALVVMGFDDFDIEFGIRL